MQESRCGIVLQAHIPTHNYIIIFDAELGKIRGIPGEFYRTTRAPAGALIEYTMRMWKNTTLIHALEITAFPIDTIRRDIFFVHQLLEITRAFLPEAMPLPEFFNFMLSLYENANEALFANVFRKKLLLCRLLARLGVYPNEMIYLEKDTIRRLILSPADIMVDSIEEDEMSKAIHIWLTGCIATHPHAQSFRTFKIL